MRKVRDFDAELKALNERAKLLKTRKIQQFGELIEAAGADALDPDVLAGALLVAVAEKDKATLSTWATRGAAFFRDTARKTSRRDRSGTAGGGAAPNSSEPA